MCFDIENGSATQLDFEAVFKDVKSQGIVVIVTTSYFEDSTWEGFPDLKGTIIAFTKSLNIGILSPQLYANNCNDPVWNGSLGFTDPGIQSAYKSCKFLAPSVNYKTDLATLKQHLPNAIGFL